MLTEKEIRENLKRNPDWEPDEFALDEDWDLYDEIKDLMETETDGDDDEEDNMQNDKTPDSESDETDYDF